MKKQIIVFVLVTVFGATTAIAHELKWDSLMLAAVKMQPHFDYEANVDSYMKLYRPDEWNRYRNDEFELQDKRQETIAIMKEQVAAFSLEEEFVVYTTFEFGDYDFKNEVFPLDALGETTYFHDRKYGYGTFPSEYKVFFSNPTKVGDINMPKSDAKDFLQSRKDRFGYVDRRLNAKIAFRITNLKNGRNELVGELTHVTIYSDDQRARVLQEY